MKNTYASETPVTDGERVYAYFGNLGLFCYDFAGEPVWSRTLGSFKTADGMGTAARRSCTARMSSCLTTTRMIRSSSRWIARPARVARRARQKAAGPRLTCGEIRCGPSS